MPFANHSICEKFYRSQCHISNWQTYGYAKHPSIDRDMEAASLSGSIAEFLAADCAHQDDSLRVIVRQLNSSQLTILELVSVTMRTTSDPSPDTSLWSSIRLTAHALQAKALGTALTSEQDAERCRGTLLLAEVPSLPHPCAASLHDN